MNSGPNPSEYKIMVKNFTETIHVLLLYPDLCPNRTWTKSSVPSLTTQSFSFDFSAWLS